MARGTLLSKLIFLGALALPFVSGCGSPSPVVVNDYEDYGVVTSSTYTPKSSTINIRPTIDGDGNAGIELEPEDIPEKYSVSFKLKDREIKVEGNQSWQKDLQAKVKSGNGAKVKVRETRKGYNVNYEIISAEPAKLPNERN